jgi:CheY-like chemotaxis protein
MNGILIIEDNPRVRRLIRSEIADLARSFYEGDDGALALELYRRFLPDWVLMDLEMKQTDGLTATREIISFFPQARICIVTNYDDDFLRQEAQAAGARGFVSKHDLFALRPFLSDDTQA